MKLVYSPLPVPLAYARRFVAVTAQSMNAGVSWVSKKSFGLALERGGLLPESV
jgi:hypothetical protein